MRKKFIVCLTALVVAVAMMPASAFAASKAKMSTYQVIKSGNTVYCAGEGDSIYKVRVKDGKVKDANKILKADFVMGDYSYVWGMKKKGGYLYYAMGSEGTWSVLYRISTSGGKPKMLAENPGCFTIKKNKLYVELYDEDQDKTRYRVMNLNGKNKKKTSVHPVNTMKESNAKGYSVKYKESGKYIKTYLKTPKGSFYLGKSRYE
ncbi:MAG: hypothetical protein IJ109_07550 [Firmicutes bacterium]|nr:hypothetical protein [Bacillota bacterium]